MTLTIFWINDIWKISSRVIKIKSRLATVQSIFIKWKFENVILRNKVSLAYLIDIVWFAFLNFQNAMFKINVIINSKQIRINVEKILSILKFLLKYQNKTWYYFVERDSNNIRFFRRFMFSWIKFLMSWNSYRIVWNL